MTTFSHEVELKGKNYVNNFIGAICSMHDNIEDFTKNHNSYLSNKIDKYNFLLKMLPKNKSIPPYPILIAVKFKESKLFDTLYEVMTTYDIDDHIRRISQGTSYKLLFEQTLKNMTPEQFDEDMTDYNNVMFLISMYKQDSDPVNIKALKAFENLYKLKYKLNELPYGALSDMISKDRLLHATNNINPEDIKLLDYSDIRLISECVTYDEAYRLIERLILGANHNIVAFE